jgi:hypothetical protein
MVANLFANLLKKIIYKFVTKDRVIFKLQPMCLKQVPKQILALFILHLVYLNLALLSLAYHSLA